MLHVGTNQAPFEAQFDSDGAEHGAAADTAVGRADGPADGADVAVDLAGGGPEELEPSAMRVRTWLADVRHDRETRKAMIARMVVDGHVYSDEEESMITRGISMLADSAHRGGSVRPFKHGLTVDKSWSELQKETGLLAGHSELVIRGAGPLDIVAYLMDINGRHWRSRWDPEVDVRKEIREVRSSHCAIEFYECKTAPFRNRSFLSAFMWKKLTDAQYV